MVKMDSEDGFGIDLVSSTDQTFQESFISVGAGTFADLDNEWGFGVQIAFKKTNDLFKVIDVVSSDGIFAISVFK